MGGTSLLKLNRSPREPTEPKTNQAANVRHSKLPSLSMVTCYKDKRTKINDHHQNSRWIRISTCV